MLLPLLFILCANFCQSYKILVVNPKMGYSHMNFLGQVADTLVDAGHEVVTLQPLIYPHVNNGTTKSRLIQVGAYMKMSKEKEEDHNERNKQTWTASATSPFGVVGFLPVLKQVTITAVTREFSFIFRSPENNQEVLDAKEVLQQLKSENFDVGITELFEFTGIAVFEAIGLKNVIGAHSSCMLEGTAFAVGLPVIPSFMPASLGVTDDASSFSTRVNNILFTFLSWYFQTSLAETAQGVMYEKLGSGITPVWDTVSNMSWILTNIDPFLEYARPTLHNIVDLGGIGVRKPKPLDEVEESYSLSRQELYNLYRCFQKWKQILNLRPRTIMISFGSVAPSITMPDKMKRAILEVVKSYPDVTFIWKYEKPDDTFADGVENLVLSKWTPQADLLADDRLALFVTHGGAGSMMESAFRGKPLIVVPLFGDQTRNAKLIVKFGFGIMLEKVRLQDSKVLHDAIGKVLSDKRYERAAHRIRDLLAKRPFTPQEKLVKTIELAAEFGELPEFKVAGRNLGLIVYYNIDIILVSVVLILFVALSLLYIAHRLYRLITSNAKTKTQ
ncbi:UDP-glucoronosyl and UDP-glucosyl transferase [Ancylostoma caninum]|uniref:glucuronosyltransferase n=1 Tax=Ancylostoma caninum TaxID=29170 RepID=A0A368GUL8_ANCCA|nr:UDP-glucoronosyl and UDP-glucosyl transferase [Ancylostoma caninum]